MIEMMFDFRGFPTEEWYKWKMRTLGAKPKTVDLYKLEGGCIICGSNELVFPLGGHITMCSNCFRNARVARDVYGEGVRWERHIALNIFIQNECNVCGRKIPSGGVYYIVNEGRICTKCTWKKLGKKQRVLKVDGERMW